MRRLIINADDFGLTAGVNRGILEGHKNGLVSSATLMANGAAFTDAITAAASVPKLSIGCHVVLVDGAPLLRVSQVSSLLQDSSHRFHNGFGGLALAAFGKRLVPDQIETEVTAQIQKLQSAGIGVSHLDSHKHVHMLPPVLRPILKAAASCGVPAIRNPFGPIHLGQFIAQPGLWKRGTQVGLLQSLAGKFLHTVKDAGMITPDGTVGIVATGAWGKGVLRSMIEDLPEGTWELVSHPGYDDTELGLIKTRLRESRFKELQLLTSPATRDMLEKAGIELISYRELVQTPASL